MAKSKVSPRGKSEGKKRPANRQGCEVPVSLSIRRAAERAGIEAQPSLDDLSLTSARDELDELILALVAMTVDARLGVVVRAEDLEPVLWSAQAVKVAFASPTTEPEPETETAVAS